MNKVLLTRQRKVRRVWMRQLLILLSVIGPGLITANVDNDATGITGYSLAGAQYGYGLLWAVVLVTISLVVVQEMTARMGVVTGKGLADLIREKFGAGATLFVHHIQINEAKDAALALAPLEIVINWGRYTELFSHVEERGIFRLEAPETREEA